MIPVPYHLQEIAELTAVGEDSLTMQLVCPCGCGRFLLFENTYTEQERAQMRLFRQTADEILRSRYLYPAPEESVLPDALPIAGLHRFSVRCADCGNAALLYDNRLHGYDGAVIGREIPPAYQPPMKQRFAGRLPARQIRVCISGGIPADALADFTGAEAANLRLLSECFTEIRIQTRGENGRYRTVFSEETG